MTHPTRTVLGGVILAALVAAIALVTPATPSLVWVGLSAMWVAILMMVLATLFVAQGRGLAAPQDFVFPVLAWRFLGLHALMTVVVLGLSALEVWSAPWAVFLVGHVVLLGVFTLQVLASSAGKVEMDQVQEAVRAKVIDWRQILADVAAARDRVPKGHSDGPAALRSLESVHDALRCSDPMSNPALSTEENRLRSAVAELVDAVGSGRLAEVSSIADRVLLRLKDRNTRLKALK